MRLKFKNLLPGEMNFKLESLIFLQSLIFNNKYEHQVLQRQILNF